MTSSTTLMRHFRNDFLLPLVSSLIIVMVLFYVDEGYYDLRWMREWGNWFVFGLYMIIFFSFQWGVMYALKKWVKPEMATLIMFVVIVPSMVFGLLWIFSQ